ncbi:MAG: PQQ-dependent sugar dehydrogenase, partial [Anaerolineae bacterium]|nr:PQQ-dependent sugar dehydrogenase [Anaerolineae bacterium]
MAARAGAIAGLFLALAACGPAQPGPSMQLGQEPTAPASPGPGAEPAVEVLAQGLDTPWAIDFAPDGRLFVTERPGRIRIVREGRLDPDPWLTLDVAEVGEAGLLGLALDPQFAENGYVYVAHTYRTAEGGLRNRLVRLREDPATGRGGLDRVLLDGVGGANLHDGGRVRFGPDGKLYWTTGDAEEPGRAQDTQSLNGKILRLNPDGSVPEDNPFAGSPVYSYGHRNPQGLAWHPDTGRLYATEHGPQANDEVNLIEARRNYGWPLASGEQAAAQTVPPLITSGAGDTWAPAGASFVTRGPWAGSLVFAGLRSQTLFRLLLDPAEPSRAVRLERWLEGRFGRLRDVA